MASPATVAAAKKRWLVPLGRRTAGWSGLVFPLSPGVSLAVCPAFFLRPALRQGQRSNIQQNPNGSKPLASCLCQSAGKISFRVGRISETFQSLSCPAECFHLRQAQFAWAWVECPFNISTVCSGRLPIGDVACPLSSRESTRNRRRGEHQCSSDSSILQLSSRYFAAAVCVRCWQSQNTRAATSASAGHQINTPSLHALYSSAGSPGHEEYRRGNGTEERAG